MKLSKLNKTFIMGRNQYTYHNDKWWVTISENNKGTHNLRMTSNDKHILLEGFELDELLDVVDVYV
jgi:hypothetical protein